MVQRYVKFGNFRSPVAASFAALQKVRSAPPVTGFLSSTFCCSLSAVRCPLSAVRCPLSAVRCSLFAVCRSPFAACCLCLLFARRLLFATLRLPPQPAITTRRPQTAAARVDSSPANPLLSGYALNRSHMCAKRRSMLFCLASDVVETEFLFIFVQINKGKQLFIPLADRGTSSGDCLNRVWLLSVLCYASTSWWGRHGHGTIFLFRLLEACIERDRLALFCWKQSRAVIIPGRRPPLHHGRDF